MRNLLLILSLGLLGCRSESVKPVPVVKESKVMTRNVSRQEKERQPQQHVVISEITNKVVTLNDDQVYCGGIWVKPTQFITAYHCIKNKHNSIYYNKKDSSRIRSGSLVKFSEQYDLALVETGDSDHLVADLAMRSSNVGDKLHIIGHTMGLSWSYMEGWTSAYRDRVSSHHYGPYLQINASIYYGDSGGGVFNEQGELIGVTSFIANVPNVAFAVHVENIRLFIK
jgi:S1-C subfamily serine protease